MTSLLFLHFSDVITSSLAAAHSIEESATSDNLGFVVLGIIVVPVLLLTIASIIEIPRKSKIPELFMGGFVLLVGGMVASLAVISLALKFIVPQ